MKTGLIMTLKLVAQLLNSDGLLLNYYEFLAKFQIPVPPKEYAIVFDAIPSGALMLLRGSILDATVAPTELFKTAIGKLFFKPY